MAPLVDGVDAVVRPGSLLLDKYRVDRIIGRGGMGVVVAARHLELGQLFAIKLLDATGFASAADRFMREARATARLRSEHAVRVFDVGRLDDGTLYLVMEYLDGEDLARDLARRGRMAVAEAVPLVLDACDALAEAHALGIIHRDLKLSNLFLVHRSAGRPQLKVIDFGISKVADAPRPLTAPGAVVGTPGWMAPEQYEDTAAIDGRSDIWALGVALYHLVTGHAPFATGGSGEVLRSVLLDEPAPPSLRYPDLPPALDAVLARCLRKRPEDRYPDVATLVTALRALLPEATPVELPAMPATATVPMTSTLPTAIHRVAVGSSVALELPVLELPGGIVPRQSPFYVARSGIDDACLAEVVKPGALLRIKGPRQMGKSSLIAGVAVHAAHAGARTVTVNLALADAAALGDHDRFLRWLCAVVARRLKLPHARIDDHWDDIFGAKDNCTAYFEEHVLPTGPIVLVIDHLDRIFETPATAEDVLSLLRAWHELGKTVSAWSALRLVLSYSTEMYLPIHTNHSPFNVGMPVMLGEWDRAIVHDLALRHGVDWTEREVDRLMALIGGHPHLIRLALYHVARGASLDTLLATAATDEGLFADHLRQLLWLVQLRADLRAAAARVMRADAPVQLGTELAFKLVSLGLANLAGNDVRPARALYRSYFDRSLQTA